MEKQKQIGVVLTDKDVIEIFEKENYKKYKIPGYQLGFGSQRQLIETAIKVLIAEELLIKQGDKK
jgi:hypothetical protein